MKKSLIQFTLIIPLVLLLCFVFSCEQPVEETEIGEQITIADIEAENKAIVQRYWDGKWNARRPEILDELQTPDVVYHGTSMEMNGIEEYKQVYSSYLSAFHDTQVTIEDLIAEGDRVMTRVTFRGVHKGELAGIAPTGKNLTISLFTVFRLVDGKIAEEWEIIDELGMMHQLGMELKPLIALFR